MTLPSTQAFRDLWNQLAGKDPRKRTLALIELTTPSALTLRYATQETTTPDGNTWQTGLVPGVIRHSVDLLGTGMAPVDTSFRLVKRRDAARSLCSLRQAHGRPGRCAEREECKYRVAPFHGWRMNCRMCSPVLARSTM